MPSIPNPNLINKLIDSRLGKGNVGVNGMYFPVDIGGRGIFPNQEDPVPVNPQPMIDPQPMIGDKNYFFPTSGVAPKILGYFDDLPMFKLCSKVINSPTNIKLSDAGMYVNLHMQSAQAVIDGANELLADNPNVFTARDAARNKINELYTNLTNVRNIFSGIDSIYSKIDNYLKYTGIDDKNINDFYEEYVKNDANATLTSKWLNLCDVSYLLALGYSSESIKHEIKAFLARNVSMQYKIFGSNLKKANFDFSSKILDFNKEYGLYGEAHGFIQVGNEFPEKTGYHQNILQAYNVYTSFSEMYPSDYYNFLLRDIFYSKFLSKKIEDLRTTNTQISRDKVTISQAQIDSLYDRTNSNDLFYHNTKLVDEIGVLRLPLQLSAGNYDLFDRFYGVTHDIFDVEARKDGSIIPLSHVANFVDEANNLILPFEDQKFTKTNGKSQISSLFRKDLFEDSVFNKDNFTRSLNLGSPRIFYQNSQTDYYRNSILKPVINSLQNSYPRFDGDAFLENKNLINSLQEKCLDFLAFSIHGFSENLGHVPEDVSYKLFKEEIFDAFFKKESNIKGAILNILIFCNSQKFLGRDVDRSLIDPALIDPDKPQNSTGKLYDFLLAKIKENKPPISDEDSRKYAVLTNYIVYFLNNIKDSINYILDEIPANDYGGSLYSNASKYFHFFGLLDICMLTCTQVLNVKITTNDNTEKYTEFLNSIDNPIPFVSNVVKNAEAIMKDSSSVFGLLELYLKSLDIILDFESKNQKTIINNLTINYFLVGEKNSSFVNKKSFITRNSLMTSNLILNDMRDAFSYSDNIGSPIYPLDSSFPTDATRQKLLDYNFLREKGISEKKLKPDGPGVSRIFCLGIPEGFLQPSKDVKLSTRLSTEIVSTKSVDTSLLRAVVPDIPGNPSIANEPSEAIDTNFSINIYKRCTDTLIYEGNVYFSYINDIKRTGDDFLNNISGLLTEYKIVNPEKLANRDTAIYEKFIKYLTGLNFSMQALAEVDPSKFTNSVSDNLVGSSNIVQSFIKNVANTVSNPDLLQAIVLRPKMYDRVLFINISDDDLINKKSGKPHYTNLDFSLDQFYFEAVNE